MVGFATLLIGLVFGVVNVELSVGDPVAAVDVYLDGELVETLKGPPWRLAVDLGPELEPHLLEAVAFDALYAEIGRARQKVNMPREAVEIAVAIEETPSGRGAVARLHWQSLLGGEPSALQVTLDGRPVEAADPGRIALPDYDPELLHLLRAELEVAGSASATAEVVFGGSWVGRATLGLTGTAIELTGRTKPPTPEEMRESFLENGQVLEVAVLDRESSEIVFVRSPAAEETLSEIAPRGSRITLLESPTAAARSGPEPRARALRDWRAQVLWPVPRPGGGGRARFDLFPHSQSFTEEDGELAGIVAGVRAPPLGGATRLADAVAVAGLTAVRTNRRRAVILVVGAGDREDASASSPAMVRRFLERLRVPLFIWSVAPGAAAPRGWGEAVDVSSRGRLERAVRQLHKALDRQRIVWLRGSFLPHEIVLAERAHGYRLAGTSGTAR